LVIRTRRDADGALALGVCIELAAGQVVSERIVHVGPEPPLELLAYVASHRARTAPGAARRISLVSVARFGRLLRDAGYRQGATVVGAGLAVEVAGLAEWWGPSRSRQGGWSFGLAGLGGPYRERPWKLYADAPAVTATAGGDHVLLGWRGGREPKPKPGERRYRPLPRRGQFLDVLTVASALAGAEVRDLAGACATFGLDAPGADKVCDLDRLRAEAHAVVAVHHAELAELDALRLGLDPAQLVSTGGVASAMWREAGVAPLANKLPLPERIAGAAASAFFGGWSAAPVVHVPTPAVQVDVSGTYPRCASAVGMRQFVVAERWEVVEVAEDARRLLADLADERRALDRAALGEIGPMLVPVVPDGHVLPVKVVRDDEARLAMAPYTNRDGVWRWAPDVLAGARLGGGAVPPIVEAVRLVPVGVQAALGKVRLPSGRVVNATDDLALAIVDDREVIRSDPSLPEWRRRLLDGMAKRAAVAMWFGNLARIDREPQARTVEDAALGPDGEQVVTRGWVIERPGPWCSLALAGMVTACARLIVADAVAGIRAVGGRWLALNTDSLVIAATHADAPELVSCPGGPVTQGRNRFLRALPVGVVEGVLDRTDALLYPGGGQAWKREAGFDRPRTAYVSGVYRVALLDDDGGDGIATEALLGGYYADPTGTAERTPDGHYRWAVEAHLAIARSGIAWDGRGPIPDLDLPAWAERLALRPGVARTPGQLARLARAFPERRQRPFTPYLEVVADRLHNVSGAIAVALDDHGPPEGWPDLGWRDPRTGEPAELTTDGGVAVNGKVAVCTVRDVLHDWRLSRDTTTRPVEAARSILEPGARETLPVRSRATLTELCGKDGDDLVARFIDPGALRGEELTTYAHAYHLPDTWGPWLERARVVGVEELARRGVPRTTAYYLLAGRLPAPDTAALVARVVADAEGDGATIGARRMCARPGCPSIVAAQRRWCSARCKKAVQRAADRVALHAGGAVRCPKCGTVRYGDHSGPCPGCDDRGAVEVLAVLCAECGIERVGDRDGPCPFCARGPHRVTDHRDLPAPPAEHPVGH
jgi:hypothetical protein